MPTNPDPSRELEPERHGLLAEKDLARSAEAIELHLAATSILERIKLHQARGNASRELPRYRVLTVLSGGTMATVLEVLDEDLQRRLAMKVLKLPNNLWIEDLGQKNRLLVSRFLHEAQVISQLDHPGVVPIYDVGMDAQGHLYYTMPLIGGHDLRTIIDLVHAGDADWNVWRMLGVILRVCEAMAYAHERGVVHRDLKPANVMIGRFGQVYVLDWGLACSVRPFPLGAGAVLPSADQPVPVLFPRTTKELLGPSNHTDSTCQGDIVGSPPYMAPEQVRGRHELVGPRSDVYSVGAILYHLLTNSMPYAHECGGLSQQDLLLRSSHEPPLAIEKLAPNVSPELAAICRKAMSREPLDRYPGMQELGRDLQAFLDNRVVRAYRTGALVELNKWCLRNKLTAIMGTVALVLLVAILAVSLASHRGDLGSLVTGSMAPPGEPPGEVSVAGLETVGFFMWDVAQDEVIWSDGARRMWGAAERDGRYPLESLFAALGEQDREGLRSALTGSLEIGSGFSVPLVLRALDGKSRNLMAHGAVLLDGRARPWRVVVFCAPVE